MENRAQSSRKQDPNKDTIAILRGQTRSTTGILITIICDRVHTASEECTPSESYVARSGRISHMHS